MLGIAPIHPRIGGRANFPFSIGTCLIPLHHVLRRAAAADAGAVVTQLAQADAWRGDPFLLHHAARLSKAAAASATSWPTISARGSSRVTIPTDWPAMSEPCSISPSITARRR